MAEYVAAYHLGTRKDEEGKVLPRNRDWVLRWRKFNYQSDKEADPRHLIFERHASEKLLPCLSKMDSKIPMDVMWGNAVVYAWQSVRGVERTIRTDSR